MWSVTLQKQEGINVVATAEFLGVSKDDENWGLQPRSRAVGLPAG